jgi:hypothetical protein
MLGLASGGTMSQIPTRARTDPVDQDRIRRNHERELHGWAKAMGTSPERLQQAVQAVGITPRKVRAYLRQWPQQPEGCARD